MTEREKMEEVAEAYATGNHRVSVPDTHDMRAVEYGWRMALKESPAVLELQRQAKCERKLGYSCHECPPCLAWIGLERAKRELEQ